MIKRILSISAQKPNSTGSGVYLTELVKAYHAAGYQQAVIAGVNQKDEVELPEGVTFYPVQFQSEELPYPVVGMSDIMPYEHTRYCDLTPEMTEQFVTAFKKRIRQAILEFRPELIICHHLYVVTALTVETVGELAEEKEAGSGKVQMGTIPGVAAICHSTCLRQYRKNALLKERIYKGIRGLDRIYALHTGQRRDISRIFNLPEAEIEIVGAGYNETVFHRGLDGAEDAGSRSADSGEIGVCFAGKVSQAKGVKSLLRAFTHIRSPRPVHLYLAGGSAEESEMKEICQMAETIREKCGRQVTFLGKLPQPELADCYRKCRVFVLPSFYEGLPLVLLEAMACGCLAVIADWEGVKEWILDKVPSASLTAVELPEMKAPGVPREEGLPEYENRLAEALDKQLAAVGQGTEQADLSALTWGCVAMHIVNKEIIPTGC